MKYVIKPIVCDYAVINVDTSRVICICNIKSNAELIADILNGDSDNERAYFYGCYPYAKYKIVKAEMITVLAQLNATNRETIRDILDDHGVLVKKGPVSKENVEEIKALARGEEPEKRIIPNAVKETLEQEIASINVCISKLQAKRDVLEEYLGWHKVDEAIEERLKGQQV